MTTLFTLIRHGETDWNRVKRWQGHADIPLNEAGESQARAAALSLVKAGITRIVASPLRRALRTAELVNAQLNLPLSLDERLREIHVGAVQGLTKEEIGQDFPDLYKALHLGHYNDVCFPEGESRAQLGQRMGEALQALAERYPHEHLLIATHGGSIRMVLHHLLNFNEENTPPVHNCSLTRLQYESQAYQWVLLEFAAHHEQVQW